VRAFNLANTQAVETNCGLEWVQKTISLLPRNHFRACSSKLAFITVLLTRCSNAAAITALLSYEKAKPNRFVQVALGAMQASVLGSSSDKPDV